MPDKTGMRDIAIFYYKAFQKLFYDITWTYLQSLIFNSFFYCSSLRFQKMRVPLFRSYWMHGELLLRLRNG